MGVFVIFCFLKYLFKFSSIAEGVLTIKANHKKSSAHEAKLHDPGAIWRYYYHLVIMLLFTVFMKIHPFAWTWPVTGSRIEPQRDEIQQGYIMLLLAKLIYIQLLYLNLS